MLPLSPPPGYFKEINSIISKFIWNDKYPRIKLTTLQHPNHAGGLAVPNFELYYWSFQLKALHNWVDPQSTFSWRVIEVDQIKPNRLRKKKGIIINLVRLWLTLLKSGKRLNVWLEDTSKFVTVHLYGTFLILYAEIVHLLNPLGLL